MKSSRSSAAFQRILDILNRVPGRGVPRSELTSLSRLPAQYIDMVIQTLLERHELEVQVEPPENGFGRTRTLYFYKPDGTLPPLQIDDAIVVDGVGQLPTVPLGRPSDVPVGPSGVGGKGCASCGRPLPPSVGRPRVYCDDACRADADSAGVQRIRRFLAVGGDPVQRLYAARQFVMLDLKSHGHVIFEESGGLRLVVEIGDRFLTLNVYLFNEGRTMAVCAEDTARLRATVYPNGKIEYQDAEGNAVDPGA